MCYFICSRFIVFTQVSLILNQSLSLWSFKTKDNFKNTGKLYRITISVIHAQNVFTHIIEIAKTCIPNWMHWTIILETKTLIDDKDAEYLYFTSEEVDDVFKSIIHESKPTVVPLIINHLFIKLITDSPLCTCGNIENANHFFFDCSLYQLWRLNLMNNVSQYT